MTFFDDELKKGNFQICYCHNCNLILWPPKEICDKCNMTSNWKKSLHKGKIIEFSKKNSEFFGIIEIEDKIRLMGNIISENEPSINQNVRMNVAYDSKPNYSFVVENNQ